MAKPIDLTDADFEKVLQGWSVGMIDFWVKDCEACRVIAPMMEEIAKKYAGKIFVGKIRADENPKAVGYFDVTSAPTILIMKNGREIDRIVMQMLLGAMKEHIVERLKQHLG
jgi:thioredoxin 1